MPENRDISPDDELARLADGSLPEPEAGALRARVADSPELTARLAEQERAIGLVRATAEIQAPASLRAAVGGRTRRPARRAWRPRMAIPLAAGAVAAIVVAVVLLSGGPGQLTVGRTAGVTLAAATRPAPPVDRADGDLLALHVGPVSFPAYEDHDDWRASGARTDELDGRRVQTVFYEVGGRRVGYSIVPGDALRVPRGRSRTIGGVRYVVAPLGSAALVTWRRDGHTCVIAGRRIGEATLLRLASASETDI